MHCSSAPEVRGARTGLLWQVAGALCLAAAVLLSIFQLNWSDVASVARASTPDAPQRRLQVATEKAAPGFSLPDLAGRRKAIFSKPLPVAQVGKVDRLIAGE